MNNITGKRENSTRYRITGKIAGAAPFNRDTGRHWVGENKVHWALDVTMGEDKSRKRKGDIAKNSSPVSKIALALIEQHRDKKANRSGKRLNALLNDDYREKIPEI